MFDTINGIPLHPLIVHGVVVLLPLAILGAIAIALRPAWRRTFGYLVIGIAVVATALIPAATQSGEKFESRLNIEVGKHSELADQLIWFALPLLVLIIALVVLDRRETVPATGLLGGSVVLKVVAGLCIVSAVAAGYQVYRVGDSGARRTWCGSGNPAYPCTPVQ